MTAEVGRGGSRGGRRGASGSGASAGARRCDEGRESGDLGRKEAG